MSKVNVSCRYLKPIQHYHSCCSFILCYHANIHYSMYTMNYFLADSSVFMNTITHTDQSMLNSWPPLFTRVLIINWDYKLQSVLDKRWKIKALLTPNPFFVCWLVFDQQRKPTMCMQHVARPPMNPAMNIPWCHYCLRVVWCSKLLGCWNCLQYI